MMKYNLGYSDAYLKFEPIESNDGFQTDMIIWNVVD